MTLTLPKKPKTVVWAILLNCAQLILSITTIVVLGDNKLLSNAKFAIIFEVAIIIYLIIKISSGRNWARITLLILTLFYVPFSIIRIMNVLSTSQFFIQLFFLSLIFFPCILLFMPSSNAWFKEMKTQR